MKKDLVAVKGLSDQKVEKIQEAARPGKGKSRWSEDVLLERFAKHRLTLQENTLQVQDSCMLGALKVFFKHFYVSVQ